MSSFLVFSNLPHDLTDADLAEILEQTGPSDRTGAQLIKDNGEVAAWVSVPWTSSVASEVAHKLHGRLWRGHELKVRASNMFKE
jgi:ribosomal protein L39E